MVSKQKLFLMGLRVLFLFVMGLAVAIVIALSQVNLETLRGNIIGILRDATGMDVEISGDVSWKLSLRPRIELNDVRIPNAEWATDKYAFTATKIDVTLNLLSVLRDRPTIQNIKIYDANISIEQDGSGQYSLVPKLVANNDVSAAIDTSARKLYPFKEPGLGGIEVTNLAANIAGASYSMAGFAIHYVPSRDAREYAGWFKATNHITPFVISYSPYNAERRVYPVRVAISTGGDALIANIALEGTSLAPIDFIIKGDIRNTEAIGHIIGMNLDFVPNMRVNISGGYDWQKLSLRKSSITVHKNTIAVSGMVNWGGTRPVINADVSSSHISLIELFPDLYGRQHTHPDRPLNVFHDIPLFGQWFAQVDGDINVSLDEFIVYRELDIADLDLKLHLNRGTARVDMKTTFANGPIRIGLDAFVNDDGNIDAAAGFVGRGISVGELLKQLRIDNIISELPVDIDGYLRASGATLSEVMHTITGPVRAYSSAPGYAHSALVSYMYGKDFLTALMDNITNLFTSSKNDDQIEIKCAVVNTKLRSGVAETRNGAVVQTPVLNLRLAGNINLGAETMKLALTTVPVSGLKLSLTGNLVNSMEITGSLAEPSMQINGAAVAGRALSATGLGLLLAPFTGGIGLVAGAGVGLLAGDLLENWLADPHPCETAMNSGAPSMTGDAQWMNVPIDELVNSVFNKD